VGHLVGIFHVVIVFLAEIGNCHLVRQILGDSEVARLRQVGGIENDKVAGVPRLDPAGKYKKFG